MSEGSQAPPNLERALGLYRRAPESKLFAPLADAYRASGQLEEAVRVLRAGLERHPRYVAAHVLLGLCFRDLRQDDEAEACFARVLELDAENLVALRYRAECARRRGTLDRAVELLRQVLEADPFDREVQADLGLLTTALERRAREERATSPPQAASASPLTPTGPPAMTSPATPPPEPFEWRWAPKPEPAPPAQRSASELRADWNAPAANPEAAGSSTAKPVVPPWEPAPELSAPWAETARPRESSLAADRIEAFMDLDVPPPTNHPGPPESPEARAANPSATPAGRPAPPGPTATPPAWAAAAAPPAGPAERGPRPLPEPDAPQPPPIDLRRVGQPPASSSIPTPLFPSLRGPLGGPAPIPPPEADSGTADRSVWKVTRQEDHIVVSPWDTPPRGPIRSVEDRLWSEQRTGRGADAAPGPSGDDTRSIPPAGPTEAPPSSAAPAGEFATLTLARIYESQGYVQKALGIYDELHRKHPQDPEIAARLAALQRRLAGISEPDAAPADVSPPAPTARLFTPPAPSAAPPAAAWSSPSRESEAPESESPSEWRLLDAEALGSPHSTAERLRQMTRDVRDQDRSRRHTVIGTPAESPPAAPRAPSPAAPPAAPEPLLEPELHEDVSRGHPDFERFLAYVRSLKQ